MHYFFDFYLIFLRGKCQLRLSCWHCYPERSWEYANDQRSKDRASSQGVGRADTGMPKQRYDRNSMVQGKAICFLSISNLWLDDRNSMVQGKGDQSAHILLTPECGEKRTAETSWIAFAADRTAECFSKRHLHYSCGADTMRCRHNVLRTALNLGNLNRLSQKRWSSVKTGSRSKCRNRQPHPNVDSALKKR